jgi:ABC-type sugar transport system substrate-binding protein
MKSALNVQTRIDGKKPDENNSFFEKLRKLIQEHSKKLNDKIDNGYDLSKFISELSGFSEQVNDFLDENPNNPQ